MPGCPSFAANLESVVFWTSPETGIHERIGDNVRIEKAATGERAAINCPSSRLYSQVGWPYRSNFQQLSISK